MSNAWLCGGVGSFLPPLPLAKVFGYPARALVLWYGGRVSLVPFN